MNISILPRTPMGKRAITMMISIAALFIFGSVLPWKSGYTGFEIVIHNPIQGIVTLLMLILGATTSGVALISVIKHKEQSALVFLAIFAGLYSILGFIGSVANVFFNYS